MNNVRGVLFDLDQTLCNSEDYALGMYSDNENNSSEMQVYNFLKPHLKIVKWETFKETYIKSRSEIKHILKGRGASHSRYLYIQRTLENMNYRFRPDLIWDATNIYWNHTIESMTLFPQVGEVLRIVKQNHLKTAIISDLTADVQIKKLKKLKIDKYIDYLITSEEADADKPNVNQANLALEKTSLTKNDVFIVGNNPLTDIELGYKMQIETVLYDQRQIYESVKTKADHYISNFYDLLKILGISKIRYSGKKLVVFDLIGTVTDEPHLVRNILTPLLSLPYKRIRKEYAEYNIDSISRNVFWKNLKVTNYEDIESRMIASVKPRVGIFDLLKKLKKKGLSTAILSNMPKEWGREVIKRYNLKSHFDEIIFSGEHKSVKPDPKLYKILISKFPKIDPQNIYFVDDKLGDLKSGKNFLMNTIWLKLEEQKIDFVPDEVIYEIGDISYILK
ncbi:MAG: HAD-IA family hydrolase [Candidatus Dojkabacteria bacterium]|nr:HAD-IA family hydrolase [Candidatus Dojkabacteria bacterium]